MIKGIIPQLSEAGKIKIGGLGEKRTSSGGKEFRLPQKHDYFTVTTTQRDAAGDLIVDEAMMAALPKDHDGKVREIPIILHDDDFEAVFPTAYALYQGKKLACRGDGETATRYEIKDGQRTGREKEMECPCDLLEKKKCKAHGTLRCSIRIADRAVAGAVHTWRTTSIISIQKMAGSLAHIRNVCGTVVGVPLVLRVQPVQVAPKGGQASTVYCCHVELRASDISAVQRQAIEAAQLRAQVRASLGGYVPPNLPAPGVDESDEEQAEIAAEFHSEEDDDGSIDAPRRLSGETETEETGEVASDEQLLELSEIASEIANETSEVEWQATLDKAVGHHDIDSVTAAQFAAAHEALDDCLAAIRGIV